MNKNIKKERERMVKKKVRKSIICIICIILVNYLLLFGYQSIPCDKPKGRKYLNKEGGLVKCFELIHPHNLVF